MNIKETVNYIINNNIEGDFVEQGVYAGLQPKLMADALLSKNIKDRNIWLYDTFAGLPEPTKEDFSLVFKEETYEDAITQYNQQKNDDGGSDRCFCSLEDVKKFVESSGYPTDKLKYIVGDIMDTLKVESNMPEKIAILRLDCDWYLPSKFGLEVMYDRVVDKGVIIFDDYRLWNGQKQATDEFFKSININPNMKKVNDCKKYKGIPKSTYIIKGE